jgi:hypothetical protein
MTFSAPLSLVFKESGYIIAVRQAQPLQVPSQSCQMVRAQRNVRCTSNNIHRTPVNSRRAPLGTALAYPCPWREIRPEGTLGSPTAAYEAAVHARTGSGTSSGATQQVRAVPRNLRRLVRALGFMARNHGRHPLVHCSCHSGKTPSGHGKLWQDRPR